MNCFFWKLNLVVIIVILYSCNNRLENLVIVNSRIEKDSLNFEIDNDRILGVQCVSENTISYFSVLLNKIIVKNLFTNKTEGFYSVDKRDEMELVNYKIKNDSEVYYIFSKEDSIVIEYNKGGKTIDRVVLTNPIFDPKNNQFYAINSFSKFYNIEFTKNYNKLYLQVHSMNNWFEKEYFNKSVLLEINFIKNSVQFCNITYPRIYSRKKIGEAFNDYNCKNNNDDFIYSFQSDPNLIKYSTKKDKYEVLKSSILNLPITEIRELDTSLNHDYNMIFKHLSDNTVFDQIVYDKFRNLYYRTFSLGKEDEKSFIGHRLKEKHNLIYLLVYNAEFQNINLINVGTSETYMNSIQMFVLRNGLYFPKLNEKKYANKIYFDVYKFDFSN